VSYQLTAGGGEAAYFRLPGTANAVLGFVTSETTQTYNNTALGTTYFLQAGDGIASFSLVEIIAAVNYVIISMFDELFNVVVLD
jgi:hypothetical protein